MALTREQAAQALEDFLNGKGGQRDWVHFISVRHEDPELEGIRVICGGLPDTHPRTRKGEYCSREGVGILRRALAHLRRPSDKGSQPPDSMRIVTELVAEKTGIPRDRISPDDRLLHDIVLYGDDASELLEELIDNHKVVMDDVAVFEKYFVEEGVPLWLLPKQWKRRLRREPLTVRQLAAAVNVGILT